MPSLLNEKEKKNFNDTRSLKKCPINCSIIFVLKEYYEIVDEARPLSGFFPTHADFFTEMHF